MDEHEGTFDPTGVDDLRDSWSLLPTSRFGDGPLALVESHLGPDCSRPVSLRRRAVRLWATSLLFASRLLPHLESL